MLLKPCPFCGEEKDLLVFSGRSMVYVNCSCGVNGPESDGLIDAKNKWNERKPIKPSRGKLMNPLSYDYQLDN